MTTRATIRSKAIAPKPNQSGRYAEMKGTTASRTPIGANESATTTTTCTATNATTRSDTLRCTNSTTKRGQFGLLQRNDVMMPSNTLAVRKTRLTIPVARETYQVKFPDASSGTKVDTTVRNRATWCGATARR